jgi:alanyl-tRNA synthetase
MGKGDGGRTAYSIELCGGTHVRRTGDIGFFQIIGESAVSAGVRRVEAVAGDAAHRHSVANTAIISSTTSTLRVTPDELSERVAVLMEERRKLERQVAELQKKLATGGAAAESEVVAGITFAPRNLGDVAPRDLKGIAETIVKQMGSGVAALVSTAEGKASIVVAVTPDLTGRISAVDLVRAASAAVGGKGGGGRPDMAQAGGPDAAAADAALAAVRAALAG